MGFIVFQSRKEGHAVLVTNVLSTSEEVSDELVGFLPGDSICLQLDMDNDLAKSLLAERISANCIREKTMTQQSEISLYEAWLNFLVIKRLHHVSRDWTNSYKLGFRALGTTIYVEAATDEEEDLFTKLQHQFNSQIDKLLLT